jgi:transposase-like protein
MIGHPGIRRDAVPKSYPPEFRLKVIGLVEPAGRCADLGISEETVYTWRLQHLIDTGQLPGTTSADNAELAPSSRRGWSR